MLFKRQINIWHIRGLSGIAAIAVIIVARMLGSLQFMELAAFDTFLRLRPDEPIDERILIVGIDEEDIQRVEKYPIPDRDIASLLRTLQTYQPAAIGLDIYRDLRQEPGHTELVSAFKEIKNLIAVEKVLPDISGKTVNPPHTLPQEQVGFADGIPDIDGKQRRSLIGTLDTKDKWQHSFSLKLATTYLATKRIPLKDDESGMKFGSTELIPFLSNSGGYVAGDDGGTQIFINFRSNRQPFRKVTLEDIKSKKVNPNWIRDKIVLIGLTNPSTKDYANSSATKSGDSTFLYGVEMQAHETSQIVSAVLDARPLINTWVEEWEYVWIILWGFAGIILGRKITSPLKLFLSFSIISASVIVISYQLLILGWWVPVLPPLFILIFNGTVLISVAFYQYGEALRARVQDRQFVIDEIFDAMHNLPLQTLAGMIREVEDNEQLPPQEFLSHLKQLNKELRILKELVQREALTDTNSIYLREEQKLDLQQPIHHILYEVYNEVLERDFPCFKTINIKVVTFEALSEHNLSIEQKRGLCRFLEEALCNIGKYAQGVTRLEVTCTQQEGRNIIRIADNGLGIDTESKSSAKSSKQGYGTKQALSFAKQLRGKFQRFPNSPKGTVCQLDW
jgi:CHASE2 domain-containing sensor protein